MKKPDRTDYRHHRRKNALNPIIAALLSLAAGLVLLMFLLKYPLNKSRQHALESTDASEETFSEEQDSPVLAYKKYLTNLLYDEGSRKSCLYDIMYLQDGKPKPLILCVHGGYYSSGDKEDMLEYLKAFSQEGYVTVSIQYPLLPEATILEQIESVMKALDYLSQYADLFEIDKEEIYLLGHSSGAQIAVSAAEKLTERNSVDYRIRSVIDISGPTDYAYLIAEYGEEPDISAAIIDGDRDADLQEEIGKIDCTLNISPDMPRVLIIHGKRDKTVPYEVSERFYESLEKAGVEADLHIIDSMAHETDYRVVIPLIREDLQTGE